MSKRFIKFASGSVLIAGLTLCGTFANGQSSAQSDAQQSGPAEGSHRGRRQRISPDQQLDHLTKALNLTDDQKNQIRPILEERQQKMQSLHSDASLSREDRMSKARSIFQESNSKIRGALNDDQKQKFDQMQQRRREHMRSHWRDENKQDHQQ
jgi:periplasmic protein CpxP/Spy